MDILRGLFAKRLIFMLLMLGLAACSVGAYPEDHEQLSEDERIVIRFSHVVGENTPKGQASRKFAERVHERTDGYVEVQVFPNSYLYRDGEELEALLDGDIQMIAPSTSKLTELVPEWQVIDLPFAFDNVAQVKAYLDSPVGQVLRDKLEQHGMYPLAFWDNGFKQMTNNRNPLIEPEDFQGLRFRVMSSEVLEEQMRLLHAEPHVDTFDQVFPLLEGGKIDAQENTISNIVSKKTHTKQDYITISNHGYLGYVVLTNKAFWSDLPDDIQVILLETMEEVTAWEMEISQEINRKNKRTLETCGCIDIHELTDEERQVWKEVLSPLHTAFAEQFGEQYIQYLPNGNKEDEG